MTACIMFTVKVVVGHHLTKHTTDHALQADEKKIIITSEGKPANQHHYYAKSGVALYEIIKEIPTHIPEFANYQCTESNNTFCLADLKSITGKDVKIHCQKLIKVKGEVHLTSGSSYEFTKSLQGPPGGDYVNMYLFGGFQDCKFSILDDRDKNNKKHVCLLDWDMGKINLAYVNRPIRIDTSLKAVDEICFIPKNEPKCMSFFTYIKEVAFNMDMYRAKFVEVKNVDKGPKYNIINMPIILADEFYPRVYNTPGTVVLKADEISVHFEDKTDYVFKKDTMACVAMHYFKRTKGFLHYFEQDNDAEYCETSLDALPKEEGDDNVVVIKPTLLPSINSDQFHLRDLNTNKITSAKKPDEKQDLYTLVPQLNSIQDKIWLTPKNGCSSLKEYRRCVVRKQNQYTVKGTFPNGGLSECANILEYRVYKTILVLINHRGDEVARKDNIYSTVSDSERGKFIKAEQARLGDFKTRNLAPKPEPTKNANILTVQQIPMIRFVFELLDGKTLSDAVVPYDEDKKLEGHLPTPTPASAPAPLTRYVIDDKKLVFDKKTSIASVRVREEPARLVEFQGVLEGTFPERPDAKSLGEYFDAKDLTGIVFDPENIAGLVYTPRGSGVVAVVETASNPDATKVKNAVIFWDAKSGDEIKRHAWDAVVASPFEGLVSPPADEGLAYEYKPADLTGLLFDKKGEAKVRCTKVVAKPPPKPIQHITFFKGPEKKVVLHKSSFEFGTKTEFKHFLGDKRMAKYGFEPATFAELGFSADRPHSAEVVCRKLPGPPVEKTFTLTNIKDNKVIPVVYQLSTPSTATVGDVLRQAGVGVPEFKGKVHAFMSTKAEPEKPVKVGLKDRLAKLAKSHDIFTIGYELLSAKPPPSKQKTVKVTTTLNGKPGETVIVKVDDKTLLNDFVPTSIKIGEHDIVFAPTDIKDLKYDPSLK